MLTLIATFLVAAFPLRGNKVQALDSNLVIDGDTVHIEQQNCPCMCPAYSVTISTRRDSALRIRGLANAYSSYNMGIASFGAKYLGMDGSGMIARCSTYAPSIAPQKDRQFIFHGRNRGWAIWADSVYPSNRGPYRYDARWRWASYDTALSWVRWIDTVKLTATPNPRIPQPRGLAVLTTLRTMRMDSIVPQSVSCDLGLVLRGLRDSTTSIEWGYRSDSCKEMPTYTKMWPKALLPIDSVPIGTTFRILDAYNSSQSAFTWRFLSERKTIDKLVLDGYAASTGATARPVTPSAGLGTTAYDLATGRRIELDKPMPTGRHLIDGKAGTRMIVVK